MARSGIAGMLGESTYQDDSHRVPFKDAKLVEGQPYMPPTTHYDIGIGSIINQLMGEGVLKDEEGFHTTLNKKDLEYLWEVLKGEHPIEDIEDKLMLRISRMDPEEKAKFYIGIGKDQKEIGFKKEIDFNKMLMKKEGGRVPFADGNGVADKEAENAMFAKRVRELMDDGYDMGEAGRQAMKEGYKQGGRVPLKKAGFTGSDIYFQDKFNEFDFWTRYNRMKPKEGFAQMWKDYKDSTKMEEDEWGKPPPIPSSVLKSGLGFILKQLASGKFNQGKRDLLEKIAKPPKPKPKVEKIEPFKWPSDKQIKKDLDKIFAEVYSKHSTKHAEGGRVPLNKGTTPYNAETFKEKSDLYLQAILGTSDKDFYRSKLQNEYKKAMKEGALSSEKAIKWIRQRAKLYSTLINESKRQERTLGQEIRGVPGFSLPTGYGVEPDINKYLEDKKALGGLAGMLGE